MKDKQVSAPKFTAGPYVVVPLEDRARKWFAVAELSAGFTVAECAGGGMPNEANATLLAAAPEMYAALAAIVAHYHGNDHGGECQECGEHPCDVECILREGFAALAKAEGGTA